MTPADLDLARRIAAVPGIWRAGMVDALGRRVLARDQDNVRIDSCWVEVAYLSEPDLDDAATRGVLLDVARETWGRPDLHACPMFSLHTGALTSWRVAIDEYTAHYAPTEGAAIAQAILATLEKP